MGIKKELNEYPLCGNSAQCVKTTLPTQIPGMVYHVSFDPPRVFDSDNSLRYVGKGHSNK